MRFHDKTTSLVSRYVIADCFYLNRNQLRDYFLLDREGFDTKHNKPCVTLCQVFYTSQTFHFLEIAQNDSNEAEYSGGIALGECEGMTISLKRARD